MIKYRIATPNDARQLLQTRHDAVMYNGREIYPLEVLQAWAPKVTEDRIVTETVSLENPEPKIAEKTQRLSQKL